MRTEALPPAMLARLEALGAELVEVAREHRDASLATREAAEPLDPAPGAPVVETDGAQVRYLDGWHEVKLGLVAGCVRGELVAPSYVAARGAGDRGLAGRAARAGARHPAGGHDPGGRGAVDLEPGGRALRAAGRDRRLLPRLRAPPGRGARAVRGRGRGAGPGRGADRRAVPARGRAGPGGAAGGAGPRPGGGRGAPQGAGLLPDQRRADGVSDVPGRRAPDRLRRGRVGGQAPGPAAHEARRHALVRRRRPRDARPAGAPRRGAAAPGPRLPAPLSRPPARRLRKHPQKLARPDPRTREASLIRQDAGEKSTSGSAVS